MGLDVDEATRRANEAGWSVRATEPDAVVTAEFNPDRLNFVFGEDRIVIYISRG